MFNVNVLDGKQQQQQLLLQKTNLPIVLLNKYPGTGSLMSKIATVR